MFDIHISTLPKVNCKLVGCDGNAFSLMGHWKKAVAKAKWPAEAINNVLDEAMSGDYDHLIAVLASHCKGGGF